MVVSYSTMLKTLIRELNSMSAEIVSGIIVMIFVLAMVYSAYRKYAPSKGHTLY